MSQKYRQRAKHREGSERERERERERGGGGSARSGVPAGERTANWTSRYPRPEPSRVLERSRRVQSEDLSPPGVHLYSHTRCKQGGVNRNLKGGQGMRCLGSAGGCGQMGPLAEISGPYLNQETLTFLLWGFTFTKYYCGNSPTLSNGVN